MKSIMILDLYRVAHKKLTLVYMFGQANLLMTLYTLNFFSDISLASIKIYSHMLYIISQII